MFTQPLKFVFLLLTLLTIPSIVSCNADVTNSSATSNTQTSSENVVKSKTQTLRGQLIYEKIPPRKSKRAYRGDEFFLVTNSQSPRRLVLRVSEQVSHEQLKSFHNQQVEINAIYVEGTRPSTEVTSCPLDADGECMPQGDGYQVLSVRVVGK
ncbi:MAG: hypothetical protein QNJ47_15410 [Nostocaceae cyanobacterium]|nr:hypothetical protein [Nostocaceae cyanobacterium]